MHRRSLHRAAALSLVALLALAGTASADSVLADGDLATPAVQGSKFLGDVPPGGEVSADVGFRLTCSGLNHVDAGQSVLLSFSGGGTVPEGGAVVSVTSATLTPPAPPWPTDLDGCPSPTPSQDGGALSHVTLRAPSTPGMHLYTIVWDRSFQPTGSSDGTALSRTLTSVDFTLRVVAANAAPVLTVPTPFTVEGDAAGGWTSDWSGVSASDAEDHPDPMPSCLPAAGAVLSLGTTSVACSVTDAAGASDSDTFDVTVVDTTAPVIAGMPEDVSVTTESSTGTSVTFTLPTASDVVDTAPVVGCTRAAGSTFAVGTTTVTCTATDASGNASSATFEVTVTLVAPAPGSTASATWLEPVAASGGTFHANRGRVIPIKVQLFVDGVERRVGDAGLTIAACGGGSPTDVDLAWGGGRWNHALDTSRLEGSCYRVTATVDDLAAGAFTLDLRGAEVAKATRGTLAATGDGVEAPRGAHGKNQRRR